MSRIAEHRARRRSGFTLAEIIIVMTLSVFILTGVMSTILFLTRSGYRSAHYNDMEGQARDCLEKFGHDVRMANAITWNSVAPTESTTRITLTLPTASAANTTVAYEYDPTAHTLSRLTPGTTEILVTGIKPDSFVLKGYKVSTDASGEPLEVQDPTDAANRGYAANDCKQLQISLTVIRTRTGTNSTTAKVISARFILRNKQVAS